jgi:hypothetical protein
VKIRFDRDGTARTIYGEEIDLTKLGTVELRRASHVDPTAELTAKARTWLLDKYEEINDHLASASPGKACWWADMMPMNGPVLGPFDTRSDALAAEVAWIDEHGMYPQLNEEDSDVN